MIYILFFCTVTLWFFLFLLWINKKRRDNGIPHPPQEKSQEEKISFLKRVFYPLWKTLKSDFKKRISGKNEDKLEKKLLQAGNPFFMSPIDFRLIQISLFLLFPTLFGIYGILLDLGKGDIFFLVLLSLMMALLIPPYYIHQKIKQRSRQALKELPDLVDLLTVSLEAGLGFDLALNKLVSQKTGVLVNEFHRCLEEIRLGKTRREALKGVKERVPLDELSILIGSILQAEKLGVSMVNILRIQSYEVRQQRKQRAEEAAMKAPIKMLFPLVIFIFPSLFMVLLGPALIQFLTTFNK